MRHEIDMIHGDIKKTLIQIAWPIILTNLIQTALGIIDMIWIGRLGSNAVSAIGTSNIIINFAIAFSMLAVTGTGVRVAQSLGQGKETDSQSYVKTGLVISLGIAILYVVIVWLFRAQFISFFHIDSEVIVGQTNDYLTHSLFGIPFLFLVSTYIAILTSYGNTKLTFRANAIGLIINIILDPLFIFGFGFIPKMGVMGAAWATNIARIVIFLILYSKTRIQFNESLQLKINKAQIFEVMRMGLPVTLQRFIFNFIAMFMARIVVSYGTDVMAAQRIGIQIESVTYVTIGGLQGAISAFIGQNYGNGNLERVNTSYRTALRLVTVFGVIVSIVFYIFAESFYAIFINERAVIEHGIIYMRAIAFSQVFMGLELLTVGAFHGIGQTTIPSVVATLFTILRIPLALLLSRAMGVIGVWWSISLSSILKGLILAGWFLLLLHRQKKSSLISLK